MNERALRCSGWLMLYLLSGKSFSRTVYVVLCRCFRRNFAFRQSASHLATILLHHWHDRMNAVPVFYYQASRFHAPCIAIIDRFKFYPINISLPRSPLSFQCHRQQVSFSCAWLGDLRAAMLCVFSLPIYFIFCILFKRATRISMSAMDALICHAVS